MPYEVENSPFGAQLAGAIASALTGYQQGRQQREENKRAQQRADEEAKYYGLQDQLAQQQIAAGTAAAQQQQRVQEFQSKLQLPKNWSKMSPDDKQSYLQVRINQANAVGDQTTVENAQNMINALQLQGTRGSQAQLNLAKVGLTDAQASNVRGLFDQQLKLAEQKGATAQQVARIRAAYRGAGGGRAGNTMLQEQEFMMRAVNSVMDRRAAAYNDLQDSIFKMQYEAHIADPNTYGAPTPQQYENVPQMVFSPGGQPVQVYVNPATGQITNQQNAPKVKTNTGGGNVGGGGGGNAGGGGGGFDIGKAASAVGAGLMNIITGGGRNMQPTQQIGNKTYYKHADGKWYPTP